MKSALVLGVAVAAGFDPEARDACTTILAGRNATTFGGTVVTHTADCYNCDWRLGQVDATAQRTHGEKFGDHTIRRFRSSYPGEVSERSATWSVENLEYATVGMDVMEPPFFEKQEEVWSTEEWVPSTVAGVVNVSTFLDIEEEFASVEALYGIANSGGLSMGESTCEGVFIGRPQRTCPTCEGPLVDVAALSKLAMRFCSTAQCAVELMGSIAEEHGYYGAEQTAQEAGETLMVADGAEAWVFHILPDDTGLSALWVAKRIADDEVSVVANSFIIRGVPSRLNRGDWRGSVHLQKVAIRSGKLVLTTEGLLDFAATFGPRDNSKTLFFSAYWTHRVWRVLSIAAPVTVRDHVQSHKADYLGSELPFAVKVERKMTLDDFFAINRDHFEGTPFDLTRGPASGPWGDPNRFDVAASGSPTAAEEARLKLPDDATAGRFERAISIFRTSYSIVVATTDRTPVVWFAPGAPHASIYVPVLVDAKVPFSLTRGSMFEHSSESLWWAVTLVSNWMRANTYEFSKRDVQAAQLAVEARFQAAVTDGQEGDFGADALEAWQSLFLKLVAKYRDNMRQSPSVGDGGVDMKKYFYPKQWLKSALWETPETAYYFPLVTPPTSPSSSSSSDAGSNKPQQTLPVWHYDGPAREPYGHSIAAFGLGVFVSAIFFTCYQSFQKSVPNDD